MPNSSSPAVASGGAYLPLAGGTLSGPLHVGDEGFISANEGYGINVTPSYGGQANFTFGSDGQFYAPAGFIIGSASLGGETVFLNSDGLETHYINADSNQPLMIYASSTSFGGNVVNLNDGSGSGGSYLHMDGGGVYEAGFLVLYDGTNYCEIDPGSDQFGNPSFFMQASVSMFGLPINMNDGSGGGGGTLNMDGGAIQFGSGGNIQDGGSIGAVSINTNSFLAIYVSESLGLVQVDLGDVNGLGNNTFISIDDNTQQINFAATNMGFFGAGSIPRPTVAGSRGGNAALSSLLAGLASLGLITNSTTT